MLFLLLPTRLLCTHTLFQLTEQADEFQQLGPPLSKPVEAKDDQLERDELKRRVEQVQQHQQVPEHINPVEGKAGMLEWWITYKDFAAFFKHLFQTNFEMDLLVGMS